MGRTLQCEVGSNAIEKPAAPVRMVDREAANPWYRWLVHFGAPLGVSLLVHAVLILVLALLTVAISRSSNASAVERIVDVQPIRIAESSREADSDPFEWATAQPLLESVFASTTPLNIPTPSIDPPEIPEPSADPDFPGFAEGRMSILGAGTGAGLSGGGGLDFGPRRAHYVVDGIVRPLQAKSVVYVIDFSGSIIMVQDELVRKLKQAVSKLQPPQVFDVVLFYTKPSGAVQSDSFASELRLADKASKEAFFRWIDNKTPQGSTEPLGAMQAALRLEPEAIIFLSDGMFEDTIVDAITKSNRRRRSRIECLVLDEALLGAPRMGPLGESDGVKRLRRLAAQNGGSATIVRDAHLAP